MKMVKINPGDPEIDKLSEEELAKYFYEHRDDESLWEQKAYSVKPGKRGESLVFQLRIGGGDLDEISLAAKDSGSNVSEFFRSAALDKARALSGNEPPTTTDMLKRKLAEAQKLVEELAKLVPPEQATRVAEERARYGTRRGKPKA